MVKTKSQFFLALFAVLLTCAAILAWNSRSAIQERQIRLTLKQSGCEKARSAGMLPASEKPGEKACKTVIFGYLGYVNDDPLEIKFGKNEIELSSDEIAMIEVNAKDE